MTTTYNEVADELVKEFKDDDTVVCDEKNIRRRAYDALNVLTAMDIISKNRKDIQWKGFPHLVGEDGGSKIGNREREKQRMQNLIEEKKAKIREKKQQLEDLATHYVSLRQLLIRNDRPEYKHAVTKHRINLPFVIGENMHGTGWRLSVSDTFPYWMKYGIWPRILIRLSICVVVQ